MGKKLASLNSEFQPFYFIKLDSKKLQIYEYIEEVLQEDMEFFGVTDPLDMNDYDFKVFSTEKEAEEYLERYLKTQQSLPRLDDGGWEPGPSLTYKRRYLVQTAMGEKNQTYRNYRKQWKS